MNTIAVDGVAPVIRVVIGACSSIMLAGLEAMITREPRMQVVGRATDFTTLELFLRSHSPDVVVAPDVVVVEFALLTEAHREMIAALQEEVAIALLITPSELATAVGLLQSGVRAILPIDVTAEEIILTIEAIATGLIVLHPDLSNAFLQMLPQWNEAEMLPGDQDAPLTPREIEILQLIATGLGNKAIARQLNISEHTVKFHISSIFSKLNASSRTEAVMVGMRQGIIFI